MAEFVRSIEIAGTADAVFRQLCDLHQLTRWSTITDTHEGSEELAMGVEFDQSIRVAGVKLPTHWRCVEYDPPRSVAYEATSAGGGRLHMRQLVSSAASGCRVDLEVNYDLPGGVLGDIADRVYLERRNEREAEHSLQNLKDIVEGRAPSSER